MEVVVNRITRDMKMSGLISEDYTEHVKFFIRLAYVAGHDNRKKDYNQSQEKKVIQEDRHHKILRTFDSMADAYRYVGMSKSGMMNAIKNNLLTWKGFYFRYANTEENGNS